MGTLIFIAIVGAIIFAAVYFDHDEINAAHDMYHDPWQHTLDELADEARATRERQMLRQSRQGQRPEEPLSDEERRARDITTEVNRRLDAITSNPEKMMAYDTDGNGVVDSEEWAELRRAIKAEVEAEFAGASTKAPEPGSVQAVLERMEAEGDEHAESEEPSGSAW